MAIVLLVMISSWGDCLIHEAESSLVATQLDAHASGDHLGLSVDNNAPPLFSLRFKKMRLIIRQTVAPIWILCLQP